MSFSPFDMVTGEAPLQGLLSLLVFCAVEADTLLCVDGFELRARQGQVWNMREAPEQEC
jgi:hypothetical protein